MTNRLRLAHVFLLLGLTIKFSCLAMDQAEIDRAIVASKGPRGQITYCVLDSFGKPVNKAKVGVVFWENDNAPTQKSGYTDAKGRFSVSVKTADDVKYGMSKEGYYETKGVYRFIDALNVSVVNGRWLPWNPTITNTLREIRHPIPMFTRNCEINVPVRDIPVGFDFMKGDLVYPYGSGTNADVYFTLTGNISHLSRGTTIFPSDAILQCSNKWDGFMLATNIEGSVFVSGYEAPTNGYQNRLVWHIDTNSIAMPFMPELGNKTHFVFRVRTAHNEKGEIVSGFYGRMHRPMKFGNGRDRNGVQFIYYINPKSNDRIIESDPSQSLFGNDYRLGVP